MALRPLFLGVAILCLSVRAVRHLPSGLEPLVFKEHAAAGEADATVDPPPTETPTKEPPRPRAWPSARRPARGWALLSPLLARRSAAAFAPGAPAVPQPPARGQAVAAPGGGPVRASPGWRSPLPVVSRSPLAQLESSKGGLEAERVGAKDAISTRRSGSKGEPAEEAKRSSVLNRVGNPSRRNNVTLREAMPHILELARDQYGSRFLQSKLDKADPEERQRVFDIIKPQVPTLASDQFGNFVIQKFFDVGTTEQRKELVTLISPNLRTLANDGLGCRVVQTALEHVTLEAQLEIAQELKDSVVQCIESLHGNFVILKCVERLPPESLTFIIQAVESDAQRIASHKHGYRVVKGLLENCRTHQLQTLVDTILGSVDRLSEDPYGTRVVQYMLEHGTVEQQRAIMRAITPRVVDFSKGKFSSIVLRTALEMSTVGEHSAQLETERAELINTVIGGEEDQNPPLVQMIVDEVGNFVVQKVIEHARGLERERLRQQLHHWMGILQNSPHGNYILDAMRKNGLG